MNLRELEALQVKARQEFEALHMRVRANPESKETAWVELHVHDIFRPAPAAAAEGAKEAKQESKDDLTALGQNIRDRLKEMFQTEAFDFMKDVYRVYLLKFAGMSAEEEAKKLQDIIVAYKINMEIDREINISGKGQELCLKEPFVVENFFPAFKEVFVTIQNVRSITTKEERKKSGQASTTEAEKSLLESYNTQDLCLSPALERSLKEKESKENPEKSKHRAYGETYLQLLQQSLKDMRAISQKTTAEATKRSSMIEQAKTARKSGMFEKAALEDQYTSPMFLLKIADLLRFIEKAQEKLHRLLTTSLLEASPASPEAAKAAAKKLDDELNNAIREFLRGFNPAAELGKFQEHAGPKILGKLNGIVQSLNPKSTQVEEMSAADVANLDEVIKARNKGAGFPS